LGAPADPDADKYLKWDDTAGELVWADAGAGGGASTALDNLASVAINLSLISDTDNTDDLGSSAKEWKDLYIDGIAYIDEIKQADNEKHYFGTGDDSSITDTGSLMTIDPDVNSVGSRYLLIDGQALMADKLMFTQTDGNEYIDSLADGYLDLGATTAIRLNANTNLGANDLTGTGEITLTKDNIGTTLTDALILDNTTNNNTSQYTPSLVLKGAIKSGGVSYPTQWYTTGEDLGIGLDSGAFWYTIRAKIPSASVDNICFTVDYLGNATVANSFRLDDDKKSLYGSVQDASVYYNGTNLIINPKEVGSGYLSILGDVNLNANGLPTTGTVVGSVAINEQSDDYTLVLGDRGKLIDMNKGTAVTLTVPKNSSVAFPTGTTIAINQKGAGQVTIAPVDGDVTISSSAGLKLVNQYSGATLTKVAENTWYCHGDTEV